MALDVRALMDGLGTAVSGLEGLVAAYGYPPMNVETPAAVVGLPDSVEYDATLGSHRVTIPVWILVSRTGDGMGIQLVADYANDSGNKSLKAEIEANTTLNGVAASTRVIDAEFVNQDWNGTNFLAVLFTIEILT